MKFNLNRAFKKIIISKDTPLDLIIFLMKTTGKTINEEKIDKKLDKIKNYLETYEDHIELSDSYSHTDLNKITSYVTDLEEPWSVRNLLISLDQLVQFHTNFKFPDTEKIVFGSKTNDNPLSYDISMCYILCKRLDIDVTREDNLHTMSEKILEVSKDKEKNFNLLKNNINNLNALELYNVSRNINIEEKPYSYSGKEHLESLSKNININYIIRNSILNNEEAIVYAAKFFNYDISESSSPINALKSITEKKDEILFTFRDDFTKKFMINPMYFKLDKFWRKNISFLYTPKILNLLKEYESVDEDSELDKIYNQSNYYDGIVDFSKDYNGAEKNIVTYGNVTTGELEIVSIRNLMDNFKAKLNFGKYSDNIEKLVNICKENKDSDYASLYKIIRFIQKFCLVTDNDIKNLKACCDKHKTTIKEIFEKLLEVSQSLKGKEKIDDFSNISIMNNILNLNKYLSDINNQELKALVDKLPLITYRDNKFCKPVNNQYVNIVEDLSNTKNLKDKTHDYLKDKTKYYAYTAYYYNYIFYKETIFDLDSY